MDLFLKVALFTLCLNWTISMHLLINSAKTPRLRFIGIFIAIVLTVLCGFLVII